MRLQLRGILLCSITPANSEFCNPERNIIINIINYQSTVNYNVIEKFHKRLILKNFEIRYQ
jgi:hypothetical protein